MQIVIDIPEKIYKVLTETAIMVTEVYPSTIERALAEGIVLPKGHGRLIDADALEYTRNDNDGEFHFWYVTRGTVDRMNTVVEADKEVDDADSN